jgi:hypothetical protein
MTDIQKINEHIKTSYNKNVNRQLSDLMLMDQFMNSESCKDILAVLHKTAEDTGIMQNERHMRIFMRQILPLVIPPGVKGCIRGGVFNSLIKKRLLKSSECKGVFSFEPRDCCHLVPEIPDWCYRKDDKTIIGYNQLDMWNGGAQINRASKYIMDENLHTRLRSKKVWIVCVVARKISLSNSKSKVFRILHRGIMKKRLLWPNDLIKYLKEV